MNQKIITTQKRTTNVKWNSSHVYCSPPRCMLVALRNVCNVIYSFYIFPHASIVILFLFLLNFFSLFCFSWSIPITYLFCADRTGCWCRWKTMSGNEKKMLDKMKQSFSEIKAAHWKLFNQNLSGCNGLNKSVLTSIVIFAAH